MNDKVSSEKGEVLINSNESKRAEEALRESEEKYRGIVELAPDGIVTVDMKGVVTSCNTATTRISGFSKDEIVGKHISKLGFLRAKDIPKYLKIFGSIVRGKVSEPFEIAWQSKDGTPHLADVRVSLMKKEGKTVGIQAMVRDITQRKKAEEETHRQSDLLQKTFDTLTDAIFILNAEVPPRIIHCNTVASAIFGYIKEEMIGKSTVFLHVNEEALKKFQSLLYPAMKKGNSYFHLPEFKMKRKDGSIFPSEHSVAQLLSDEGKRIGWVSLVRDITERRKADEAVRKSEEKYRDLFNHARDTIVTLDLKGNITSVNNKIQEYGYDQSEVIGKSMLSFVPKEYWQQFRDHFSELAHGKLVQGEFKIKDKQRQGYIIAEYRSNPIIQDNKVVGVQTIIREITERKEMEEKLRQYSEHLEALIQKRTTELLESETRYSILVEEAGDGVAILQNEKVVFANRKLGEILGYPKGKLIGLSFEKIIDEKYLQLAKKRHSQKLRREPTPETTEYELITRIGERIPVEVTGTRLDYRGHGATIVVVRDIRERKRLEEQRLKLEKMVTLGELATMVAHDLRNPLTSIRNAGFYIKNTCPFHANAECKTSLEMLDIIEQETIFANDIINDLLDFAAKRPLQKKKHNINKLIDHSLTRSKIPKNIKIETNFAKKPVANVDEKQLERVFLNLTKNAVQAMPNGGKLATTTNETKDYIEIALADTGVGIPEGNMNKIFQPLFTTKAKGIGMGLAICKGIVEQHNGTIEVKSKIGQGTTITIKLPKSEETNN